MMRLLFLSKLIYCNTVVLKHFPVMGDNITAYNSNKSYGLKRELGYNPYSLLLPVK